MTTAIVEELKEIEQEQKKQTDKRKLVDCLVCGKNKTTQYYDGVCASCVVEQRVAMRLRGEHVVYPTDQRKDMNKAYEQAKDTDPKMAAVLLAKMSYYSPSLGRREL